MKIRYISITCAMLLLTSAATAMVGGPLFCVGNKVTSMTVEVERVDYSVPMSADLSGRGGSQTQRLFLTGSYGLAEFVDAHVKLGAADLNFDEFNNGFSPFASDPSFAWGAGLKAGIPFNEKLQLNASCDYIGFNAEGEVSRTGRTISNKYLWQELRPAVTLGYRISDVTPYVGVSKTFLTGNREFTVAYNGNILDAASGSETYTDGEQPISPLVGLEWHLPDGYSLTGEAASGEDGNFGISIGLSQALR
ncbi:MAG: hypothetical protein IPK53_06700 [bacterium]|nr:hypothetical protein [bacterium]MBK8128635.1 hypothetical protein [bacterium]